MPMDQLLNDIQISRLIEMSNSSSLIFSEKIKAITAAGWMQKHRVDMLTQMGYLSAEITRKSLIEVIKEPMINPNRERMHEGADSELFTSDQLSLLARIKIQRVQEADKEMARLAAKMLAENKKNGSSSFKTEN